MVIKRISSSVKLTSVSPLARVLASLLVVFVGFGCSPNAVPGPDKQFSGMAEGAMSGAGAGAITGFQLGGVTGPGAAIGAGVGAVAGAVQGAFLDDLEDRQRLVSANALRESERTLAFTKLQEHYARRMRLFPSRDIFPGDVFFSGDSTRICPEAMPLLKEFAALQKNHHPWSRLGVTTYVVAAKRDGEYAQHLAEERARSLGNFLVRYGIEPRRIEARGMIVDSPVVVDPQDHPLRYAQAVEFSSLDRSP